MFLVAPVLKEFLQYARIGVMAEFLYRNDGQRAERLRPPRGMDAPRPLLVAVHAVRAIHSMTDPGRD
jgi:hypothetical protein